MAPFCFNDDLKPQIGSTRFPLLTAPGAASAPDPDTAVLGQLEAMNAAIAEVGAIVRAQESDPLRSALTAILAAEEPALGQIGPVTQALAAQVRNLTTIGPNEPG